ncbi:hypothetical protein [Luteitalea sp.]
MSDSWFEEGWKALQSSHPHITSGLPAGRHYLCPICLRAGSEEALARELITVEHVPPKNIGGRPMLLTCKDCNSSAGHLFDCHLRGEADLWGFAAGDVQDLPVRLTTASGRVNAKLHAAGNGYVINLSGKGFSDTDRTGVRADLDAATVGDAWKQFGFNIRFRPYNTRRAATAWLRTAYLAAFAKLGYRYVLRPELDAVRRKLLNPDIKEPSAFRVRWTEGTEPDLVLIDEPTEVRSLAMVYPPWMVLLPRIGDTTVYERLANLPKGPIAFRGSRLGWPSGPEFGRRHSLSPSADLSG